MSIRDLKKVDDVDRTEDQMQSMLADLDLSPLFYEPEQTGMFARFVPYVTIGLLAILLIVGLIK